MRGRLFAAGLIFLVGIAGIGALIWDHQAIQAQRIEAEAVMLRASDINALAEAIGCPQRGVSGDLIKPLIEQLTACAKAKKPCP